MTMTLEQYIQEHINGGRVEQLRLNPFTTDSGEELYHPLLIMDDGSTLEFLPSDDLACEEHGVMIYIRKRR